MQKIEFIERHSQNKVTENPPGEGALKFLYQNFFGKLSLNLLIKRKIVSEIYGRLMDKPSSKKKIAPFVAEYNINLSEAVKSLEEFTSFNDFFYRKLKAGSREIKSGVVSPADGKILAFNRASDVSKFYIKGEEFTLEKFLNDENLATEYQNAKMVIVRLAPNDYHRFHFPAMGMASKVKKVNGDYYSVSPIALATGFTKVFCENKREYVKLNTKEFGEMLICPIGATMVGSIIETYEPNSTVKKGAEMGYFAFGGSSVVVLLKNDKLQLSADLLKNSENGIETFLFMGDTIAE
ncbi:archaetidylserine decarboxylase [Lentisphaerota bacterium WC36G]|nr:archaetidylserine decarboxylase [Lentisphaerae bacterium WC36]